MPLGMADVATVLFTRFLKFDPKTPQWPDRDRFVLSAGHGSMLLYALLHLTGYDVSIDDLKRFRQLGSPTPGHPEFGHTPGVEVTTGPLGQGFASAVGLALAERMLNASFGDSLVDHYTYVLASDGDLMEGISHEALSLAGHLGLSKLIVLFDDNGISIDGPLTLSDSSDVLGRFRAGGWWTTRIDGHDPEAIETAITQARETNRPSLIACRTTIGYGAPTKAGTASSHGSPLGTQECAGTKAALGWIHEPFHIPESLYRQWRMPGHAGEQARQEWEQRLASQPEDVRTRFEERLAPLNAEALRPLFERIKQAFLEQGKSLASRQASGEVLEKIADCIPQLVIGSADLTPSNNLGSPKKLGAIAPHTFSGRYIHYGIREHAMGAVMNGLALHGGFLPIGGTFLTFSDYMRPAMRMAALSKIPVIYVMTHDSIGLGEDGPTHQPIEHLSSFRAMPNMRVLRPADSIETAECWQIALDRRDGPTLLALSRQSLPLISPQPLPPGNRLTYGAYPLLGSDIPQPDVLVFATGSEVSLAHEAGKQLMEKGFRVRVLSVPCLKRFLESDHRDKWHISPSLQCRVAIEAGVRWGWDSIIGPEGIFIGMSDFGASAPYQDLYKHFHITVEDTVERVLKFFKQNGAK
jgi:transketolase